MKGKIIGLILAISLLIVISLSIKNNFTKKVEVENIICKENKLIIKLSRKIEGDFLLKVYTDFVNIYTGIEINSSEIEINLPGNVKLIKKIEIINRNDCSRNITYKGWIKC